jgi:uncharacterized SAM-binding protein YcdF (DUF218 family)
MFFALSKVASFFTSASNILITLGLVGLLLSGTRFGRAGRRLMGVSVLALAFVGFTPLGNVLLLPLEDRFPAWDKSRGAPDGILVLGGSIDNFVAATRSDSQLNESAERMTATVSLARQYPAAKIAFSGGSGFLIADIQMEEPIAADLFEQLGLSRGRLILEDRSRNTAENAAFSKAVIKPKPGERWLLITSAYHMPRAIGSFRAVGFSVEPYPVDWRTRGAEDQLRWFANLGDGLKRTDVAVREWIGLAAYRFTGRSAALFPAP